MWGTYQKLVFTHPIVVLKRGLKKLLDKKFDRVNRPLNEEIMTDQQCAGLTEVFTSLQRSQNKLLKTILKHNNAAGGIQGDPFSTLPSSKLDITRKPISQIQFCKKIMIVENFNY